MKKIPMKKIPTLFVRDTENMKLVTKEINPDASWMFSVRPIPTIKKDGTNVRITVQNGKVTQVEKRKNPTREQKSLGEKPTYINANRNDPSDQYIFAAVDNDKNVQYWPDGAWSCEALGPKIQGGIESQVPMLYNFERFPNVIPYEEFDLTYDSIKEYLSKNEIEGIVWHAYDKSNFAKIKRRDFGFEWPVKK